MYKIGFNIIDIKIDNTVIIDLAKQRFSIRRHFDNRLLDLAKGMGIGVYTIWEALEFGVKLIPSALVNANAYYHAELDVIIMNENMLFCRSKEFTNSVLAHELAHATGHTKRLDRPWLGAYREEIYKEPDSIERHGKILAYHHTEEYFAQLTALMLCEELGMLTKEVNDTSLEYLKIYSMAHVTIAMQWRDKAIVYLLSGIEQRKAA